MINIKILVLGLALATAATGCSSGSSSSDGGTNDSGDTDTNCALGGTYNSDFTIGTQSDVATLAGYTSISGSLHINCNSCTDLSELICLASVDENLGIFNNPALTNVDGLSNITSVGWSLWIQSNAVLTSLNGLSALTSVGDAFEFYLNDILPDCEVCELLDQITSGPLSIDVHDNLDDTCTPVPAGCP